MADKLNESDAASLQQFTVFNVNNVFLSAMVLNLDQICRESYISLLVKTWLIVAA